MSTAPITPEDPRPFDPDGPAAISEGALARRWAARVPLARDESGYLKPFAMVGTVAVVSIDGPLMQRGGWWFDGHDAVADRVKAALSDVGVRAVVLKINSPGGVVSGMDAAALAIREAATAARKPMVAYADEMACSAAYRLACAADRILLPPSGQVGSVGVLSVLVDRTKANADAGLDVRVIRSGAQKADGHPDAPLTDETVARERALVDRLAEGFIATVAAARRLDAGKVRALEGAVVWGGDAVAAGLADEVCTWEECLSRAGAMVPTNGSATRATRQGNAMDENERKLLAAVLALTGETDPEKATGKVAAWKDSSERLTALQSANEQRDAAERVKTREAIIAKGVDDRKITPAKAAEIRAGKTWHASLSNDGLQAHVDELAPQAPAANAVQQPTTLPALGGTSATGGKSAEVDVESITLTAEEKRAAKQFGNSEADVLAMKRRDARAAQGEVV